MHETLKQCHQAEHEHASGQPYMGPELFQQDVGRYFKEDVWDEEYDEGGVVLISPGVELELGRKTKYICIGDVDSVQKGEQI